MRNPLAAYYGWMIRTADRAPASQATTMLLWALPFVGFMLPVFLFEGPVTLTDWRSVNLSPPALAGWFWLSGSMIWAGYSLWRVVRSWVRGIRAGWRNQPLPPGDD